MRIISKTQIKTTLLALLTCLIFSFFGCSQLEQHSVRTGSVSFTLNPAREAVTDAETFIDIELRGDYEDSQTLPYEAGKTTAVTFNNVPVGKKVSVYAQIYSDYDGAKAVTYFGESEEKKITSGENTFSVSLGIAYNSIAKGKSSCLILKPLFTSEATNKTLNSTTLNFTENSETFSYKINQLIQEENLFLDDYQKAVIYIKSNSTGDHFIRPKLVKSTTAAMYYLSDDDGVLVPEEPLEIDIMQGINIDSIGFENSWDESNWAADQSITIEKIELFKDTSMIDNEFNVVTKTATTYTVKNPALQKMVRYMGIEKNKVTFTAGLAQSIEGNPYNAAYWEFEDLYQYDKVTIKFKAGNGKKFMVNGYLPPNITKHIDLQHSSDVPVEGQSGEYENRIVATGDSQSKEFSMTLLTKDLDSNNLKAIEFKNDSGLDEWPLEIQEIKLVKTIPNYNVLNDILGQISSLTSSGTIKAIQDSEITASELESIANNIRTLNADKPDVEVTLDLSNLTGVETLSGYTFSDQNEDPYNQRFYLFQDNSNLVEISLPSSFKNLIYVFQNCSKLETVIIPDTLTTLSDGMFKGCGMLRELKVIDENGTEKTSFGNYWLENNAIYTNDSLNIDHILLKEYYNKASKESPVFVSNVYRICDSAFNSCSFVDVTIPNSVQMINENVFTNCTSLQNVTLPGSLTTIPNYTFKGCTGLESFEIPDGYANIGQFAFSGCTSLYDVTIPDSVNSIDSGAFQNCSNLKEISLPDTVTTIGQSAFKNSGLTSIKIPSGVTDLTSSSFSNCSSLKNVIVSEGVETIMGEAFISSDIENITLPLSLTTINSSAFQSCNNISKVFYRGKESDRTSLTITSGGNTTLTNATWVYTIGGGALNKGENRGTFDNNIIGEEYVEISDLFVEPNLVTQSEFEKYMTYYGKVNNSSEVPSETGNSKKTTPAYYVSWIDAIIYCNLRSEAEGLTPVYKMNGSNKITAENSPWTQTYNVAKDANGKYYFNNSAHDISSFDKVDSGIFDFDFSANGYRLPTSAEYAHIQIYQPALVTSGEYNEWCNNFTGGGIVEGENMDCKRFWFNGSNDAIDPNPKDCNTRETSLGFRVVRNLE